MNPDNCLQKIMHERAEGIVPPPELKEKVMNNIVFSKGEKKMKKRMVAGILAAALLIPTSAFAYQSLLADELYGSFENVKKHAASITMEGYMLFNAKLSQAKGELGAEEYAEFKRFLKVISTAKVNYGDPYGNIDYDRIGEVKKEEIKQALLAVLPYFDKLNGKKSSRDVLTAQEYERYIDALMTHEKVMAQSGIDPSAGPIEIEKLPEVLQQEYQAAVDVMEYVSKK
ncbi:DUF3600 domain-containing protein [Aneurinibacillus sp. REN35]|uniref:DUF3600 domain-containing protein n=1 Tax=Aneurinibacillus sp. REN35 TaxID=3237286 RepID=UPI0035273168